MRKRFFFLAASVSSLAAAAVAQGCGDSESTPGAADAGQDVVADVGKKDTAVEDPDSNTCDINADLTAQIPDADIADGASTSGICISCAKANCQKNIDSCDQDCTCQELAAKALGCYTKTGNAIACVGQFASSTIPMSTQSIGIALFGCINMHCKDECATAAFNDGGTDAGDGGDADAGN